MIDPRRQYFCHHADWRKILRKWLYCKVQCWTMYFNCFYFSLYTTHFSAIRMYKLFFGTKTCYALHCSQRSCGPRRSQTNSSLPSRLSGRRAAPTSDPSRRLLPPRYLRRTIPTRGLLSWPRGKRGPLRRRATTRAPPNGPILSSALYLRQCTLKVPVMFHIFVDTWRYI